MRQSRLTSVLVLLAMMVILLPGSSFSEVSFSPLDPITHGLKFPEDVAVAPDGIVYAVDGFRGLVMIYGSSGMPIGSIRMPKPTSVAVNVNGLVYIGSNEDQSVRILDSSHAVIGLLGSGAGEFKFPRNIAVDKTTGNVYVVDQLDHLIKIYTGDGKYIFAFSDYPNLPQDVTVVNGEIYVVDSPLVTDSWGGTIRSAKIRVFDMSGNETRSFGTYGNQQGQLIRPAGITSGDEGILYVTDSFHGVALCFDTLGNYQGAVYSRANPMMTPVGITLGEDRRLLIASMNTASLHGFGLEGYTPQLDVTPTYIFFNGESGSSGPSAQSLIIRNGAASSRTYTVTKDQGWLILDKTSLTIDSNRSGAVSADVDLTGLAVGSYNGLVTVADVSGISKPIPVTLQVTAPVVPGLTVSPRALNVEYAIGGDPPPPQTATIELVNAGGVAWTASSDRQWINITPSGGMGSAVTFAEVRVSPAGLEPGDYAGALTVYANGASGSPAVIEVTLAVRHNGQADVNCNIEDASFKLEGPGGARYKGSGKTWSVAGLPDGTYTIKYDPVTGYKAPPSEAKELKGGETLIFNGEYFSLAKKSDIVISCASKYRKLAGTGVFDGDGAMLFSFFPF
ncbi:MAG: hypothetical protein AB1442_07960, partial [Nitrospirota bacterium]